MKKLLLMLLVLIFPFCFIGCSQQQSEPTYQYQYIMECIESTGNYSIYYDKNTKVMYIKGSSGYTVMVNPDGTPQLYKGE